VTAACDGLAIVRNPHSHHKFLDSQLLSCSRSKELKRSHSGVPAFRYPSTVLHEFVRAQKYATEELILHRKGEKGVSGRLQLESEAGRAALLELIIRAGRIDDPTTYHAALLIDRQRIRGIDFQAVRKRRFYKEEIPAGWHQNVIDPNSGENRHESCPTMEALSDLRDFISKVAALWNITLPELEEEPL
jgi:hypothetical protein